MSNNKQLPEGWRMVKFGDMATHISKRVEPSETNLNIYVGLEHLDPDSLRIKRHGVPSDVAGQKLLVKKGQIIFGKRRAYQRKLGVADWDCICSAHAMVLEANSETILPDFLPFFMQSDVFMNRAVAISEGSLSPTIKWKILAEQKFYFPCKEIQETLLKILATLEKSLIQIDETIFSAERLLSISRRELLNNSVKTCKLSAIANIIMGQSPSGNNCSDIKTDDSAPLLNGPTEFGDKFPTPIQYTIEKTRMAKPGDILFCVRGSTTGRMNFSDQDYCIGRGLASISGKEGKAETGYVFHIMCDIKDSIFNEAKGGGSTFPNIASKQLNDWLVPYHDDNKRTLITKALDSVIENISLLKNKRESILRLKMAILNDLGK